MWSAHSFSTSLIAIALSQSDHSVATEPLEKYGS